MSRPQSSGSSPLKSRKLRALRNGLYDVPLVSLSARLRSSGAQNETTPRSTSQTPGKPAYADANGRWWDASYTLGRSAPMVHLATPFRPDEDHTSPKERQLLAFVQSNPKPQPRDFSSYRDYETAIVRWKEITESAIRSADIELPSPQGRFHYRPVFNPHSRNKAQNHSPQTSSSDENTADKRTTSSTDLLRDSSPKTVVSPTHSNHTTPIGTPQLQRVKISRMGSETSGTQTPKSEKNTNRLARDPWDAILIPTEPDPEDFDTFEAFEAAMRRWGHLVSQIEVIPMHARQLPSVIPLAVPAQQQQVKTSEQILGMPLEAPRRVGLPLIDFWDPLRTPGWRDGVGPTYEKVVTPFLPDVEVDDLPLLVAGADEVIDSGPVPRHPGTSHLSPPPLDSPSTSYSEALALRHSAGSASTSTAASRFGSICKDDVIADVHTGLTAIYNRAMQNNQKYPPYHNTPVVGELKGSFQKPNWASGNRARFPLRNDALRRTDLTPLQIESSHVGPAIVDGRPIQFNLPEFDLSGLSYRDLVQDAAYRQKVANRVLELQFHTQHDQCYSWHRKTPEAKIFQQKKALKALVRSKGRTVSITELSDILLGSMDLDVFQDFLGEDTELSNGETTTVGNVLAQSVKIEQFPIILDLFKRTQEPLAHSKISIFVSTVLQFSKAHELVQFLVSNGTSGQEKQTSSTPQFAHLASHATDMLTSPRLFMGTLRNKGPIMGLTYLPLLCYALSYFRPVRLDLFPYSSELVSLAANVIGTEYKPTMELVFVYYYVKTIQAILHTQTLEYGTAASHVNRTLNAVSVSLAGQLVAYPAFLGSLISSIGFRSVTVSSLFTFLTLQLLHCDKIGTNHSFSLDGNSRTQRTTIEFGSPSTPSNAMNQNGTNLQQSLDMAAQIKSLLADQSVDLIGKCLQKLASSKFTHVRQACQRIVAVLSSPSWLDTSLALIEDSGFTPGGALATIMNPSESTSPHYLEALGVILSKGIERAIQSADYLISNPGHSTNMVPAPIASVLRPTPLQSPKLTSSTASANSNGGAPSAGTYAYASNVTTTSPVAPLRLNAIGSPSPTPVRSVAPGLIPHSELVTQHSSAIGFLLSNPVLYSLLSVCGKTLSEVDFRTQFATSLLGKIGRACTRFRTFKLAPSMASHERSSSSRRVSVFTLQQPIALESEPILSAMRDWTQFSEHERIVRIGTHEFYGIFQFLYSANGPVPRLIHASKADLLVCLRQFLKSSVLFEAIKGEPEMHQTLSSLSRAPPLSTNTEAWRCLYQMVKFHPNTVEFLVKNKYLNLYFEGLGSYGSSDKWVGLIMTQNALKYMTKLFSLNHDPNILLKRGERSSGSGPLSPHLPNSPSSSGATSPASNGAISPVVPPAHAPPSPSKQHSNPDAKALSQFIINTHVFIKFHVIYKKLSELDCGAAYAELISFYHALLTLPNCKKLLKATAKHDSFREGISAVTQLLPHIDEMQKQERLWRAARATITKERIRAFKLREKDDAHLTSPRKKDKGKDVKDKDKDKDKDKRKTKEKEKFPKRSKSSSTGSSSAIVSPRSTSQPSSPAGTTIIRPQTASPSNNPVTSSNLTSTYSTSPNSTGEASDVDTDSKSDSVSMAMQN